MRNDLALELLQKDDIIDSLHQHLEGKEDHADDEEYIGGYSE